MSYTLTAEPRWIIRDEDGAVIPFHEANVDYVEYLSWLDAGNEPSPAPPPGVTLPAETPIEDRIDALETRVEELEGARG